MAAMIRKLMVEVVDGRNLSPKDGHGSSSPYVQVDYYGQRKRTRTAIRDLNPKWNEVLDFSGGKRSDVFGDVLELDVFHDRNFGPTRRNNFLGRIRLSSTQFVAKGEEALIYYPLQRKSLFNPIQGDIGLKIYFLNQIVTPPLPPPPPPLMPVQGDEEKTTVSAVPNSVSQATAASTANEEKSHIPDHEDATSPKAEQAPTRETPSEEAVATEAEIQSPPKPNELESSKLVAPASEASDPVSVQIVGDDHKENKVVDASTCKPSPEVKLDEINLLQPIKGTTPAAKHTLEQTESLPIERSKFDLVEKMHFLFVRVVKARSLLSNGTPVVKIEVSGQEIRVRSPARKINNTLEWDQTFAVARDAPESSSIMEISVWDHQSSSDVASDRFLGGICFDVSEIPLRDPPDSPLAPQWYRLEDGEAANGCLMLATWIGTQADEAFSEAWKTHTAGIDDANSRAKVYQSPKLWYLRATVLEAQDVTPPPTATKDFSFLIKAQLGFQVSKTKISVVRNGAPAWNEDLMFVASEPLCEHLVFILESRRPKGAIALGVARIPLSAIERRVDDRKVNAQWITLEDPESEKRTYRGRLHIILCFDGGYHVMDESAHVCSDYRPTARQLWKPPVGTIELGIIGCKNLLPLKTINDRGCTDAYCVAKYGSKWVRTRTIPQNLDPKWNEQYTWQVYDPCTVLTMAVFDSSVVREIDGSKESNRLDLRIGKVRIRISNLETDRVYRNTYPLLLLSSSGPRKMGEVEIAMRFVKTTPTLDFIHMYSLPLLPLMHHKKPLGGAQQELLRSAAVKIVAGHLSRSEPPLLREVVNYMLDGGSASFSMRRVRANWCRVVNAVAGVLKVIKWVDDTRWWRNPTATMLAHALLLMLTWFPHLMIPTLSFYIFMIGIWNYRFRSRDPLPHFDTRISLVDVIDGDELDEELDTMPSSRSYEVVRARYDKLRAVGARVQTVLGDLAAQCERVQALVTWRDPRGSGIFVGLCFAVAILLYVVPSKLLAVSFGFYYLRHPIFRDPSPSSSLNFFRRLPSLSHRMM